jgi:hypothetical protein
LIMNTKSGPTKRFLLAGTAAAAVAAGSLISAPTSLADPPPCFGPNGGVCAGDGAAGVAVPGADASADGSGAVANVPGGNITTGPGYASATVPGANAQAGPGNAGFCINGWCANAG